MNEEWELINLEVTTGGLAQYVPIEARRTSENFFQIVSSPLDEHIGSYKEGDVVRCAWRYYGHGFDGGIVAISHSESKLPEFSVGDKVRVSEHAGWRASFFGTVKSGPESTETRLGISALYWVGFEEPQKNRSEEDKYVQAQISNVYLESA